MATQIPPSTKKQRREAQSGHADLTETPVDLPNVRIRLEASESGEQLPQSLHIPAVTDVKQLEMLVNQLLNNEESVPYEFALAQSDPSQSKPPLEIKNGLYTDILKPGIRSTEDELVLVYTPRAVFKVRSITRSSGVALGHGATILTAKFAPHTATRSVTGAGDCTARLWNSDSGTPVKTLGGHGDHVLCVAWCPDGTAVATASRDASVRVWDPSTGELIGRNLVGHSKFVTDLCWEPLHTLVGSQKRLPRLASSSKDGTVRIWDVETGVCEYVLSGHTNSVSCVRWGGENCIYTGSHDKTMKTWDARSGKLLSNHQSHAHWINHIALSTDYALRSGPYGPTTLLTTPIPEFGSDSVQLRAIALKKYEMAKGPGHERVVTASDDFTMFLWEPLNAIKPVARMTGHQKLVNQVSFSPDSSMLASVSFDNSVKLWDGRTGKFIASLRGHVAAVYQCAWSADSRLLVSCSKDTTLKVWDVRTRKLKSDLPGHQDEVFAVDWSIDGTKVCSGSKDKTVRFWTY